MTNRRISFETLNAYADGESDAAAAEDVARAIAGDPALAHEVAALSRLRSAVAESIEATPDRATPQFVQFAEAVPGAYVPDLSASRLSLVHAAVVPFTGRRQALLAETVLHASRQHLPFGKEARIALRTSRDKSAPCMAWDAYGGIPFQPHPQAQICPC